MYKIFYNKRAQNFVEYAMLVSVIASALIAMTLYIKRSLNARLREVQKELSESRR